LSQYNYSSNFQRSLFLRITTLLSWTKSTLLLKNKCFGKTTYKKTQCYQTNETQHCFGKESALGAGWGVERVALIKSLIYARRRGLGCQVQLKMSADTTISKFPDE